MIRAHLFRIWSSKPKLLSSTTIIPVILSGGSGTRLWPLSRELYPKQFHALVGEQTLLQATAARLQGMGDVSAPIIVCNHEHRFMVAEQLRQMSIEPAAIYLEPEARNTAPAAAIAALAALEMDTDPIMLVLPADHIISDPQALHAAVTTAAEWARSGYMATLGIRPIEPETGYGYIKQGACLQRSADGDNTGSTNADKSVLPIFEVEQFVEKPALDVAERYLASGNYLWNSGMFVFSATRYLEELTTHRPEVVEACRGAMADAQVDLDFVRIDAAAFSRCPSDSIDYAVMEHCQRAVVVPLDAGWSDVGSWSSLWDVVRQDDNGNVIVGDVMSVDVRDSYIHAQDRLVAGIGLDEHVIVETSDAVLVARKDRMQDVKQIVEQLRSADREEHRVHKRVRRPWGSYECVNMGERFQVKKLVINPGAKLSLQFHKHRAEHWVVVRGEAKIIRGEETLTLGEDQSTYIPLGAMHQLENAGDVPLEVIEVQTGSYLGEDDIVRLEDRYGRA